MRNVDVHRVAQAVAVLTQRATSKLNLRGVWSKLRQVFAESLKAWSLSEHLLLEQSLSFESDAFDLKPVCAFLDDGMNAKKIHTLNLIGGRYGIVENMIFKCLCQREFLPT